MRPIEEFCTRATDEDWDNLAEEIRALGDSEEKKKEFTATHGYLPTSIGGYMKQHYLEVEKRQALIEEEVTKRLAAYEEQVQMLQKQIARHSQANEEINPEFRKVKGEIQRAHFYATKESIELFNQAVDSLCTECGYRKNIAAALMLEEISKRYL